MTMTDFDTMTVEQLVRYAEHTTPHPTVPYSDYFREGLDELVAANDDVIVEVDRRERQLVYSRDLDGTCDAWMIVLDDVPAEVLDTHPNAEGEYTTSGSVRGTCGHAHPSMYAAVHCLESDRADCRRAGGYSDRKIVRRDGAPLNELDRRREEEAYGLLDGDV